MRKRGFMLLFALVITIQLAGCGNDKSKEVMEEVPEAAVEEAAVPDTATDTDSLSTVAEADTDIEYITQPAELVCVLPDGFVAAANEDGLYVHQTYPNDTATISYVISDGSEDVTQMSAQDYEIGIEESYYDTYGDEVDVEISSYKDVVVDGRKALEIRISYEFKGIGYEQLIYMIYNGTETHIMNYTQEADGNWMEAFEKSGASIWFKPFEE